MEAQTSPKKVTEKKTVSIYEKIQNTRVELQKRDIKKSGKMGGRDEKPYLELADFSNPLNEIMLEQRFTAIATFTPELATLTAYDFDSDQTHAITSPMREAKVPGCNDMQNLGAVETYQRRYLYMAMFDVAESDILDGSLEKGTQTPKQPINKPTPEQLKECTALNIDINKVAVHYKTTVEGISAEQVAEAIATQKLALEKIKQKKAVEQPPAEGEEGK